MENNNYHWISFSDVMTALMVLFLFIAVSFMLKVEEDSQQMEDVLEDFVGTKRSLIYDLDSVLHPIMDKYNNIVLDTTDLSVTFQDMDVLFSEGSSAISPKFEKMLNQFIPAYLGVLTKEKYTDKIAEIRIEGHTDTKPSNQTNSPYIDNLILSQERATNVIYHIIKSKEFDESPHKKWLQFRLQAIGYSFSKRIDAGGNFTYFSNMPMDKKRSRRVEFKIVTHSEKLIEEALKYSK